MPDFFPGFERRRVATSGAEINLVTGGSGPPLLLLHGYPQSLLMWHAAAPLLTDRHTVVAADLAGYGDSFRPAPAADHAPHSKRAMAVDQVEAMAALGFERFPVAGHDRGGRVAYRMALDHPDRVERLAVLDIVPTGDVWRRADGRFAQGYWHWGFLSQPAPLPERLIGADPDAWFDHHVTRLGIRDDPARYPAEVVGGYRRALADPAAIEAICEDYRAGASIDAEHDEADRGRRRIACPVLALWGSRGALPRFYDDVLAIWREWAGDVRGGAVEATHFLVEDRPEEVAAALTEFLSG
jgi:haloacetate dehalogenase